MSVKKQVFKLVLTDTVVQEILQNGGGEIRVNTSVYPDLNTVDQEYWKFHTPYGLPGDELVILEDYAIREVSQTSDGFYTVIEYKDGTRIRQQSRVSAAITPKGCWLTANTMPACFSRVNAVIQSVDMSIDNTQWIYIISQTNLPTVDIDWTLGAGDVGSGGTVSGTGGCGCGCGQ